MKNSHKALAVSFLLLGISAADPWNLLAGGDVRKRGAGIRVGTPPATRQRPLETPVQPPPDLPDPPSSPAATPPPSPSPQQVSSDPLELPLPPLSWVDRASSASRTLGDLNDSGQIRSLYTGLGRVAGEMAVMEVSNQSKSPLKLQFVPGMVLESPPDAGAQPLMLEEEFSLSLAPGETAKRNLICYCLDYNVQPPDKGTQIPYFWSNRVSSHWADTVRVLAAGLQLDKNGGYSPILAPLQHRRVVIQRAIWEQLMQVEGMESLQKDIVKDSQGQITRRTAERVSKGIYDDIQKTLTQARSIR